MPAPKEPPPVQQEDAAVTQKMRKVSGFGA